MCFVSFYVSLAATQLENNENGREIVYCNGLIDDSMKQLFDGAVMRS